MARFTPKFITFDCYGTLTNYDMAGAATQIYASQMTKAELDAFLFSFRGYRLDETMSAWKPKKELVCNALERTCKKHRIEYRREDGEAIYNAIPTWGPHPDVTEGLSKIADKIPLVILSNAAPDQIIQSAELHQVAYHKLLTAEDAQAYKPRQRAFEYMLDVLDCDPADILHVSSSFRYDLMTCYDMGIRNKVWVNRGHEPANPFYEYAEIADTRGLPALVGL